MQLKRHANLASIEAAASRGDDLTSTTMDGVCVQRDIVQVEADAAHVLNRLLIGITSMALYLALSLVPWRLPIGAGLAAAGCFMFVPLVPWWGHTVAVEPGAAATTALAFLAACIHAQLRDRESAQGVPASGLFLAATTAFAVYFRPESMLVFPLVALVLWSTDDRFIEDLSAWAALALAVALACPNVLHLWSMHTEDWGATDGRRFAVDFIAKNLHSNGGYFFNSTWFPLSGAMLALAGIGWLLIRNRTAGFALGVWFALSWGTFILFYAGGYHYGASSRYAIVSCAPLAVFMGIGLTSVGGALRRFPVALYGLAAVLVVNWTSAMHFVPTLSREAAEASAVSLRRREPPPKKQHRHQQRLRRWRERRKQQQPRRAPSPAAPQQTPASAAAAAAWGRRTRAAAGPGRTPRSPPPARAPTAAAVPPIGEEH